VRSVNLLPEQYRPRRPSGGAGGAYVVLGVLGALLVASVVYVLALNQIGAREDEIAKTKTEAAEAEAKSKALAPVANFLQVKQQREQSVKQLASERFDWERMVLELSRVMPAGVYLKSAQASVKGEPPEAAGGGGGGATSSTLASGTAAPTGEPTAPPTLNLKGCAPNQPTVATMLVRLRRLHHAADVKLTKSGEGEDQAAAGAVAGAGGGEEEQSCAAGEYEFETSIVFEPTVAAGASKTPDNKVPTSLGGGG